MVKRFSPMVAGVALTAGIACCVPAHANPGTVNDDNFLAAIGRAGITYHSKLQALAAGQAVCGLMDNGMSGIDVVSNVRKANPGFTLDGAATFAAIAANEYCPKHLSHASP